MSIKPVINNQQLKEFSRIALSAYPGIEPSLESLNERLQNANAEDKDSIYYLCERGGKSLGGYRHIDYVLNYNNNYIKASGIGMVAVDLLEKKQGAAKEMVEYYLEQSFRNGQHIAMLYSFRPDFYYKMGFGYGPKNYYFEFRPESFNKVSDRSRLTFLNGSDLPLLADCYLRYANEQHGYCKRNCFELTSFRKKYEKEGTVVGFKSNGYIDGYIYFTLSRVSKDNFIRQKMIIKEWIYNTPEAFKALSGFLEMQKDQVEFIEYQTQKEDFLFALKDVRMIDLKLYPGVSHKVAHQGMGMMYRIVDVEAFLTEISKFQKFNCPDIIIAIAIEDSFREKNQGVYNIRVKNKELTLTKDENNAIPVKMNIADFSSIMMGSAKIRNLFDLGKIECNKKDLEILECFFNFSKKPECITLF
jgi:predicted acetyltransferase